MSDACQKCGAKDQSIRYVAHCPRRDCDHKYCGDRLNVACNTCGFTFVRLPLDTEAPR